MRCRSTTQSTETLPTMVAYFQKRVAQSENKLEVLALTYMIELFNWS
ncbi:hypothetical protein JFR02_002753 [Vibrio harveyi]|nr:hypothetical protein [Vibrio harveyi]